MKFAKATKQIVATAALLLAGSSLAQSAAFGYWGGTIAPGLLDLGMNVLIEGTEDAPSVTLDIPIQGLYDFALSDVVIDGDTVSFAMPGVPGDPVFNGTVAGDEITGTFSQSGQDFEFVLARAEEGESVLQRPQEPLPPFPYEVEEVSLVSPAGDVTLAGSLTLPEGDGPFTALVFITGSGAQDRNESLFGHKPFLVLADELTRAGYATLRLDDRGVGGSGGADMDASYEDMTTDSVTAVEFLRARDDIANVGLIGHSQGGYLAPLVAEQTPVDFVISLAGPAVSGTDVLLLQNRKLIESSAPTDGSVTPEEIEAAVQGQLEFLDSIIEVMSEGDFEAARELTRAQMEPALAGMGLEPEQQEAMIQEQVNANVNQAMASFMAFDPQPSLSKLTVPVLAIFGGLDIQVDAEQSTGPLEAALAEAGNEDFTITVVDDMNHILQPAVIGSLDEYATIETTVHQDVLDAVLGWMAERY